MNKEQEFEETKISFKTPLILFDEECTLCKRFKDSLEKIPGIEKFSLVPLQNENVFSVFPQLKKEECFETLHLIDEEGRIHKGGSAISLLIEQFPIVSNFSWLVEKDMGKKTLNFFYNVINKYRKAFKNKCPKCNKERPFL
jgi:predicted DCC family thiol-disulfide oxidoreductase YuxK